MNNYAFVLPRYWHGIAGGAETLAGELAQKLAARGDSVRILTTCAKDNRSWENAFHPGDEYDGSLRISRFPVDPRNLEEWIPLQISISRGVRLSVEDELRWMQHSVNSSPMYSELARRASTFDMIFFAPYLFGTTFWGSLIKPERSCLIPCLHDESYAYTSVIESMFRQVRGALFNSRPEQELANRLYGPVPGGEVGMGFEPERYEGASRYFTEPFPYLLYIGRKETGKNVQLLIDYFIAGKESGRLDTALKLVIAGGGSFADLHRPEAASRSDVLDIPHLSEEQKQSLVCGAQVLVQPSVNESFSIVLMEAWLLGVPALVHAACAVTRDHVVKSSGGLYFTDEFDFCGAVSAMTGDNALRARLAQCGRRYVLDYYNWDAVLSRFDRVLDKIRSSNRLCAAELR